MDAPERTRDGARDGARDAELKKELDATLQARRELGEEYDSALVESFLDKVEQRLDSVVDRRVRRQLAEERTTVARGARRGRTGDGWGERFGFTAVSLVLAIPLSAIAVANAHLPGLLIAWGGIVGVNAVHAGGWPPQWRRERAERGRQDSDWEE
ncbi:hypothetical protein [Streptomyces sp. VRA16 Mangrove soil]|uniref:hypothetical protein n=1 Tax=Streptomyces sp. VRA16 Mangrove soil TaxID=2817434 RepID=UPI001A9D45EC|nr:hypothetical protein [Streptomyces sp. VRA16 Mangrove soil]MBO1336605.1 hypothetical protein [Streptomyces sp. VRA16 Mangrove soil]